MRFWFEHSSEVTLREQVVTQVSLGILSGELAAGERLPSIRELARRFKLHPNTVSAGYRQLEAEGWVASRKGSGVYVRLQRPSTLPEQASAEHQLQRLVTNLFGAARNLGIGPAAVVERVRAAAAEQPPDHVLLIEPDVELRRIVEAELREAVAAPTDGAPYRIEACGFGECAKRLAGALIVTLPRKLEEVRNEVAALDVQAVSRVVALRIQSVPLSVAQHLPREAAGANGRSGMLVAVASRWPEFLRIARTMLVAVGFDADALMLRDAGEPGWQDGLGEAAGVICDTLTARELPDGVRVVVSPVLAAGVAAEVAALLGARSPGES